ncbi:MAG: NAD-dependent epimerase/dehydratase family protein, partial [Candidatus Hydrogenedentes bacterium]|nr:NAD-dependent epimerase/dehydratase family protein [Candidatus Hydrogenedentota bacterium]
LGTRNVIECCLRAGVGHLIVTSSGAAYGYYADNPQPLHEDDRLRGNPEFAYSDHKRQVEEMLAEYRRSHPGLKQLVFRPGTILGETTSNQITALFERRWILGIAGAPTPFVFIWDQDVAACIVKGIVERREGVYNLAGDGTVTLKEIAATLRRRYIAVPPALLGATLRVLKPIGVSQYGPEQVDFLRYRPVLANDKLKHEFGYTPAKTTADVFEFYARAKGLI